MMGYIVFGLVWGAAFLALVEYLETIFPGLKNRAKKIFVNALVIFYISYIWLLFEGWLYSNLQAGQRAFGWIIIYQFLRWYARTLVDKSHKAKQFWVIFFVPDTLIKSAGIVWYLFAVLCQNYVTSGDHVWSYWIEFEPLHYNGLVDRYESDMDSFFSVLGTCVKWLAIYLVLMISSVSIPVKR